MNGPPNHTTPLRSAGGALKRWPPVLEERPGALDSVVKITPISGGRGRTAHERRFEVSANWHGPGLEGLPPVPGGVDATDLILVEDLELARAVAGAAVDELKQLRPPDLRVLERRLRERR